MVTEDDLLQALIQEMALPPLLENDVTVGRLAAAFMPRKSEKTVKRYLESLVENGKLIKLECRNQYGRKVMVYRRKP